MISLPSLINKQLQISIHRSCSFIILKSSRLKAQLHRACPQSFDILVNVAIFRLYTWDNFLDKHTVTERLANTIKTPSIATTLAHSMTYSSFHTNSIVRKRIVGRDVLERQSEQLIFANFDDCAASRSWRMAPFRIIMRKDWIQLLHGKLQRNPSMPETVIQWLSLSLHSCSKKPFENLWNQPGMATVTWLTLGCKSASMIWNCATELMFLLENDKIDVNLRPMRTTRLAICTLSIPQRWVENWVALQVKIISELIEKKNLQSLRRRQLGDQTYLQLLQMLQTLTSSQSSIHWQVLQYNKIPESIQHGDSLWILRGTPDWFHWVSHQEFALLPNLEIIFKKKIIINAIVLLFLPTAGKTLPTRQINFFCRSPHALSPLAMMSDA